MKKFLAFISVVFVILIGVVVVAFVSSSNVKVFESGAAMQEAVDGVWISEETLKIYIVDNGQLIIYTDAIMENLIYELESGVYNVDGMTFDSFYDTIFLQSPYLVKQTVVYDYKKGKLLADNASKTVLLEIDKEQNLALWSEDTTILKASDSASYFRDVIEEAYKTQIDAAISYRKALVKYSNYPTAKDVQYNKLGYIGKEFFISGTATLDDYYNWGYRDFSPIYFCISVEPEDGAYLSDRWYIYASRKDYPELFESLKSGSKKVNFVAKTLFYDTGSDNMATLVEIAK